MRKSVPKGQIEFWPTLFIQFKIKKREKKKNSIHTPNEAKFSEKGQCSLSNNTDKIS